MSKKITTDQFIEKSKTIHGGKFDYSKTVYIGDGKKVTIICPKHGEFSIVANSFKYSKHGCPKCGNESTGNSTRLTTNNFISRSIETHGYKYDYSKVEYIDSNHKVEIICNMHGSFLQRPFKHMSGHKCPKCSKSYKYTRSTFIKEAIGVHGDIYDYSKVKYISSHIHVDIICKVHGVFSPAPSMHLQGKKCPYCSGKKQNTYFFIKKAKEKHGLRYDYSKVEYVNRNTKVKIICKDHGIFFQIPAGHLNGSNCPECVGKKIYSKQDFINKSIKLYGSKYNYLSLPEKIRSHTRIKFICKKHGVFEVKAYRHLQYQECPECKGVSIGEKLVLDFLVKNGIENETQKRAGKSQRRFDFYLPYYDLYIEFNGKQHYEPVEFFGGLKTFKRQQKSDQYKRDWCEENNHNLLEIKYTEIKNMDNIIRKITEEIKLLELLEQEYGDAI